MNTRWRLSRHGHYKELCALASLGELPAGEAENMKGHLNACSDCREAYSGYAGINAAMIPEQSEDEGIIASLEEGSRVAVWESIARSQDRPVERRHFAEPQIVGSASRLTVKWAAAVVVTALGCFALGIRYELFRSYSSLENNQHSTAVARPEQQVGKTSTDQTPAFKQTSAVEDRLREDLSGERRHSKLLEAALAEKEKELAYVKDHNQSLRERITAEERELADTKSLLAAKSVELKQVQDSQASDKTTVVALQYQVHELTDRLNSETDNLQRERDLLSKGREIRDIVGARSLHIVDVYDADAKGRTQRPFARAFYTEGKSLVFYAYDLPMHSGDTKPTYVAWGEKNGNGSSIRSLGILVNDDQGQKRWSLSFSDPKTLAEIDSVFITLESSGDAGKPSGKRMLTAYLNDEVNHP